MAGQFESNSYKSKEPIPVEEIKEKAKPIEGKVIVRKKGPLKRLVSTIFSDDADSVKTYVVQEVLIPSVKKLISDVMSNGTDILLYGESRRNKPQNSNGSRISYSSYSGYYSQTNAKPDPAKKASNEFSQDIILETRGQAEDVLIRLEEIIDKYKMVSVSDLNDILNISGPFTDAKYGWRDISSAQIVRVRDGFLLKLPRVQPLN